MRMAGRLPMRSISAMSPPTMGMTTRLFAMLDPKTVCPIACASAKPPK